MIRLVENIIRKNIRNLVEGKDQLSFLKFSTPTSGSSLKGKVIFLVFKNNDKNPFLCVKTVRWYGAKGEVIRNFENLKSLNILTKASSFQKLFAQALYLHDDGYNIFGVESVCLGRKVNSSPRNLGRVLDRYIPLQGYLAEKSSGTRESLEEYAEELIRKAGVPRKEQKQLVTFFKGLPLDENLRLPKIIQHGDLTLDNILVCHGQLSIVDYDYVGINFVPGFDIFNFLLKYKKENFPSLIKIYLEQYFQAINVDIKNYDGLLFLYYLEELARKKHLLEKMGADEIINNFKSFTF